MIWNKSEVRQHFRGYAPTFVVEFAALFCQIAVYKLAAHYVGKEGFSEYAVARRTISFLYPIALMGLGVALPRYLGYASARKSGVSRPYFGATVKCVALITLLMISAINVFPHYFAYLFFGSSQFAALAFPMSVLFAGSVFHAAVYSYFRGHLKMGIANTLQFLNQGLLPLLAFFIFGQTVRSVLLASGGMILAVDSIGFAFTPVREVLHNGFAEAKELLIYGIPRVVGDFALMALMMLPVTIVAHTAGVQEAGFLSAGITALSLIGTCFSSVGLILLPQASRMLAEGLGVELRRHVGRIIKITVFVSLIMNVILGVFAGALIRTYLGPRYSEVASYVKLLAFGAVPYSLYYVLRGLVDAYYRKAVNTFNSIVSLAFLGVASLVLWLGNEVTLIPAAFLMSVFILGTLTSSEARKILRSPVRAYRPDTLFEEVSVGQ